MEEIIEKDKQMEEPTGRNLIRERLKLIYPDKSYPDDVDDDYTDFVGRYDNLDETSKKIADSIKNNPRNAELLQTLLSGENLVPAIVKMYGKEILEIDPDEEDFKKALQSFDEKATQSIEDENLREQLRQEFEENLASSEPQLEQFAREHKLSEERFSEMMKWAVENLINPLYNGIFSADLLSIVKKAYDYDNDITESMEAGKAAGRTEKIRTRIEQKPTDGLPNLSSSSAGRSAKQDKQEALFGRDNLIGKNTKPFERKGFK